MNTSNNDEKISIKYRRYVDTVDGPYPEISYKDTSVITVSDFNIKINQLISGQINDIEISPTDEKKFVEYININTRKPLESMIAAAIISQTLNIPYKENKLIEQLAKKPLLAYQYASRLHSCRLLYEKMNVTPNINTKPINYNFMNAIINKFPSRQTSKYNLYVKTKIEDALNHME